MLIDAIALVALAAAVLHGLRRGALGPLLLLGAAAVSVLAAGGLEPALRPAVVLAFPEATPATRHLVGTLTAGGALYALLALGVHCGVGLIRSSGCLVRWIDGVAGMGVGLLRASVLVSFALWLLAGWAHAPPPPSEARAMAALRGQADRSLGVRVVGRLPSHLGLSTPLAPSGFPPALPLPSEMFPEDQPSEALRSSGSEAAVPLPGAAPD